MGVAVGARIPSRRDTALLLAFGLERVSLQTAVPFEFINGLLSTSGILFGFSSLIILSKDWVDRRVWTVISNGMPRCFIDDRNISRFGWKITTTSAEII
jgi:hypothetical protein